MKLHLGCGNKVIPGFIGVDIVKYNAVDIVSDVRNLKYILDDMADLIYACHVLEHFHQDSVIVLREWNRVLKPGGTLRIAVPDFKMIFEVYKRSRSTKAIKGLIYGRSDTPFMHHYKAFDFNSLKADLLASGFKDIRPYDWRETEHADIDDFSQAYWPHMDKENGLLVSLNVEATK